MAAGPNMESNVPNEQTNGRIFDGEKVVFDGPLWIATHDHPGGFKSWEGGFTCAAASAPGMGGSLRVELRDGRKGIMFVNGRRHYQDGDLLKAEMGFQGTGPLE
jgi:hypothetical protein